jgi:phosphatidylglycerophosphate synthase
LILSVLAVARGFNPLPIFLVQLLLLWFSSVLDKIDGELARYQSHFSQTGIFYDLVYHFFYPVAFYLSAGWYFYIVLNRPAIFMGAVILAVIAAVYKMAGKIRHHVRYKIILESHQDVLADYLAPASKIETSRFSVWLEKVIRQGVMMIYGSVWATYLFIAVLSYFYLSAAAALYLFHSALSLLVISKKLFIDFPRQSLFSRDDF